MEPDSFHLESARFKLPFHAAILLLAMLACMSRSQAKIETLTFDDLVLTPPREFIPSGYGGLGWGNAGLQNPADTPIQPNGYYGGSGKVAVTGYQNPMVISKGGTFNAYDTDVGAAWNNDLQVTFRAEYPDHTFVSKTFTVGTGSSSSASLNFFGIVSLKISAAGGTQAYPNYTSATHCYIDNFRYSLPNTPPAISGLSDQEITANPEYPPTMQFSVSDTDTPVVDLVVSTSFSTPSPCSVVQSGSAGNYTLTFTPSPGQTGTTTVTVTASDGELTTTESFVITIPNTPPEISAIQDQTVEFDEVPAPQDFTVSDKESPAADLVITIFSSYLQLVPLNAIAIEGTGEHRKVRVTPVQGISGASKITLTVSDGNLTTLESFIVTVGPKPEPFLILEGTKGEIILGNYSFPPREAGQTVSKTFTIRNFGKDNLKIYSVKLTDNPNKVFRIVQMPDKTTLAQDETTQLTISCTPPANFGFKCKLLISCNDPRYSPFGVQLTNEFFIFEPEIQVLDAKGDELESGDKFECGNVARFSEKVLKLKINNAGKGVLRNLKVSIEGRKGISDFQTEKLEPVELGPGLATILKVKFRPTSTGARAAKLKISSTDTDENPFVLNLQGTGVKDASTGPNLVSAGPMLAAGDLVQAVSRGSKDEGVFVCAADDHKYVALEVKKPAGSNSSLPIVEVSGDLINWYSGRDYCIMIHEDSTRATFRDLTPLRAGIKRYIRTRYHRRDPAGSP